MSSALLSCQGNAYARRGSWSDVEDQMQVAAVLAQERSPQLTDTHTSNGCNHYRLYHSYVTRRPHWRLKPSFTFCSGKPTLTLRLTSGCHDTQSVWKLISIKPQVTSSSTTTFIESAYIPNSMADLQSLEQRLEAISVQDENYDSNAPVAQHKPKVWRCYERHQDTHI